MTDRELIIAQLENAMVYHLRKQSDLFSSKKTCAFHYVSSDAIMQAIRVLEDPTIAPTSLANQA